MEFLTSQFRQIRGRMAGSSPSQWIAIVMFTIVLAVSFVWMMNWAGQGEWTPLLDQPLTAEEMQRVRAELATAGVSTRVEGDRLTIKGGDDARQQWHAFLAERGTLPHDTSLSYREIVNKTNPFTGDREKKWIESRGLETELSRVISRFRGVKEARVLVTVPMARGLSRVGASSASVNVVMKSGDTLDKARVNAIANFVAGAVPGLSPREVKITDGAQFFRPTDTADGIPSDMLDLQRQNEDHAARKIYDQLRHIRGVVVNVHAELRTAEEQKTNKELGPASPSKETSKTEEIVDGGNAAAPGVRPNEGRVLADVGAGTSSTKEDTIVEYGPERNTKQTIVKELPGTVERLTASISLPYSYLESVYRKQQGIAADTAVKTAEIDPVATAQIVRIRGLVKPLISAKDDEQVAVDWYFDTEGAAGGGAGAAATQAAEAGAIPMLREYGPKVGMGLLALLSLFIVARIAKKAPTIMGLPAIEAEKPARGTRRGRGRRQGDEDEKELESFDVPLAVGEAHEMTGVLEGREVDESVIRTQQIVKQIAELVKDDPRAAAGLVERWARKD